MKKYYIGIDIGGTNTRIALLNKRFSILQKASFPTNFYKTPREIIFAVVESALSILRNNKIRSSQLIGAGVGIAGQVNAKDGTIFNLTNLPGWRGINIKKILEKSLRVPVYVDNDVNVMALAELHKGAGRGSRNLVCITLGTGVGGGIIINGRLFRGSTSSAGEIGHIPINEKGPRCNCGGLACVESYVGNNYLVKELTAAIKNNKKTIMKKMVNKNFTNITPQLADKAARRGDRSAINFWKKTGTRIGTMLAGVINLLDPDKVIIGGGISGAGRFLLDPIRKTVNQRAMKLQRRHVKIIKARLGRDAGLVGAAVLASLEKNR